MSPESDVSQLPFARVYGGPLEEFVRRRDTLAKELRAAGDRDTAAAAKALRKPSRTAWALDQGAISDGAALDALVRAAAEMLEAQAGGSDVRAALATLRGAVRAFAERAAAAAEQAGQRVAAGGLVTAVLAVLGRPDSFDQLRAGRLVEIPEAGGLDVLAALPVAAAPAIESPAPAAAQPKRPRARDEERAARAAVDAAVTALAESQRRFDQARAQLAEAEAQLADADARVRRAEEDARAARAGAEQARRQADATAARVREAEDALDQARRLLPKE